MATQKQALISGNQKTRARLYVNQPLVEAGLELTLDKEASHYLVKVMRGQTGDRFAIFNGSDGEWFAELVEPSKSKAALRLIEQSRKPYAMPPLTLAFPPLRKERLAFLIEKAVELGVTHFQPFISDFTNWKFNAEKVEKIALEAVEQCERLDLPSFATIATLTDILQKPVLVALERGEQTNRVTDLEVSESPTLLIGPEGGFSPVERELIANSNNATAVSLGTSILRAETAGIVGLTLIQSRRGII